MSDVVRNYCAAYLNARAKAYDLHAGALDQDAEADSIYGNEQGARANRGLAAEYRQMASETRRAAEEEHRRSARV